MILSGTNRVPRRTTFFWRPDEDGTITVVRQDGVVFKLNETEALVWRLCDGNNSISEIEHHIANYYNESELKDFLKELKKAQLIMYHHDNP